MNSTLEESQGSSLGLQPSDLHVTNKTRVSIQYGFLFCFGFLAVQLVPNMPSSDSAGQYLLVAGTNLSTFHTVTLGFSLIYVPYKRPIRLFHKFGGE